MQRIKIREMEYKGMLADLHVHTKCSVDSEAMMRNYVIQAKSKGIQMVCFTDHVDYNRLDMGYGYYDAEAYFKEFNRIKEEFREDVKLLSGIEFGEPHLYTKELEELKKYPYDFIIGSIHWVDGMFPEKRIRDKYSLDEFMEMCRVETLAMVRAGGFHSLGHLDFPKRYYGENYTLKAEWKEVFYGMVQKGIALEINTSSLRKGLPEAMPDEEVLKLYKECGGVMVTIGSDAHKVEELGEGMGYAKNLIQKMGLQEAYFEKGVKHYWEEDPKSP